MNTAYLGLGSNLGNRLAFLRGGRDALLNQTEIVLIQASGVYETEAIGGPTDNPHFLNTEARLGCHLGKTFQRVLV